MASLDSGGGGSDEDDEQRDRQERAEEADASGADDTGAVDELTERDQGSSGPAEGSRSGDPRNQADEQLPGSGGGGGSRQPDTTGSGTGDESGGAGGGGGSSGGGAGGDSGSAGGTFDDTPDEEVGRPPSDPTGDVQPPEMGTPDDARSTIGQRGEQAEQAAEQFVEENEVVDDSSMLRVERVFRDGEWKYEVRVRDEARDFVLRQQAASEFEDFGPNDLTVTRQDGKFVVSPTEAAVRSEAAGEFSEFGPGDFDVAQEDGKLNVSISTDAQREQALDEITQNADLDRGDIESVEVKEGSVDVQFTDEFRREQAADKAISEFKSDQRPTGTGLDPGQALPPVRQQLGEEDVDVELDDETATASVSEDVIRNAEPAEVPDAEPVGGPATESEDEGPRGFDRVTEAADVDVKPVRFNRDAIESGGGGLFLPPSVDADFQPEALGLPSREDVGAAGASVVGALTATRDFDTNVEPVQLENVERTQETVESAGTPGGEFFAPGSLSPGSSENISKELPGREAVERDARNTTIRAATGLENFGESLTATRDFDTNVEVVREEDIEQTGRAIGGAAVAGRDAVTETRDFDTNVDPVRLEDVERTRETVGSVGAPDRTFFDPGALSPGSSEEVSRGVPTREEVEADPSVQLGSELLRDVEAGVPQGVEAGESDPRITEAGVVGGAAASGRTVDPVRGLLTRSPVSPGRRARTAGKVLAGGVALGAGAITAEEIDQRLEEDEPTAETAGTATEVGLGERVTTTEIEVSEGVTGVTELEVGESATGSQELEVGDPAPSSEIEPSEPGRETTLELPGEGASDATTGEQPADGSVVPSDFPLAGRDFPLDPGQERRQQRRPADIISTGVRASPMQQQISPEEVIVDEEIQRRRRAQNRELDEILRGPPGEVTIGREPGTGFPAERRFPTGASAVVGRELDMASQAGELDVLREPESVGSQIESQGPLQRDTLGVGAIEDTSVGQEPLTGLDVEQDTAQLLTPQLQQETGLQTTPATEVATPTETMLEPQFENLFEQGPGFGTQTPATAASNVVPALSGDAPEPPDRRERFQFFEREVIAPVEENPLSSIDEDLKDL